jgi:hypothetical protein
LHADLSEKFWVKPKAPIASVLFLRFFYQGQGLDSGDVEVVARMLGAVDDSGAEQLFTVSFDDKNNSVSRPLSSRIMALTRGSRAFMGVVF